MNRQLKNKIITTVIAGILLLGCYYMILMFSSDSGDESSNISRKITEIIYTWYYRFFGETSTEEILFVAEEEDSLEKLIRKLAHFSEYMAVGFLSYTIAVLWMKRIGLGFGLVILQLFISGGLDEFHQTFVPGRYGSFKDVLIDVAGGITGMIFILWMKGLKKKRWNRIQKPESGICS